MSHATGEVIVGGKTVAWFLYDGTHDVALPSLWPTGSQAWKHSWGGIESHCTCGRPPTDVLLYSGYGGGFYWPAEACLPCRVIVSNTMPFEELLEGQRRDGYPLYLSGKFRAGDTSGADAAYASILPYAHTTVRAVARLACVSEVSLGPLQDVRLGPTALTIVEEGPGRLRVDVRELTSRQEIRVSTSDPAKARAALEKAFGPGRS